MALLYPTTQFFDNSGDPLAAGLVYTYEAGTTTPKTTYTDSTEGASHPNPVVLDSAGRADIWLSSTGNYKLVVKTASGTTLETLDQVTGLGTSISSFSTLSSDLDTNGFDLITSSSNTNITLTPHGTGQTIISAPYFPGAAIQDTNKNEIIKLGTTASAVNEVTITNAATGNAPVISATGGDANINLSLASKGSGTIELADNTNVTGTLTADGSLGIAGTASSAAYISLAEDTDNGTNTVTIIAPASIASNKTATLQDVTGTLALTSEINGVPLSTLSLSGSSEATFTSLMSSTYKRYQLVIHHLNTSVDNVELRMSVSNDNGSTWNGGGTYVVRVLSFATGSTAGTTSASAAPLPLTGTTHTMNQSNYLSGILNIFVDSATAQVSWLSGHMMYLSDSTTNLVTTEVFATLDYNQNALNAIKIVLESGTMTGSMSLIGFKA